MSGADDPGLVALSVLLVHEQLSDVTIDDWG